MAQSDEIFAHALGLLNFARATADVPLRRAFVRAARSTWRLARQVRALSR